MDKKELKQKYEENLYWLYNQLFLYWALFRVSNRPEKSINQEIERIKKQVAKDQDDLIGVLLSMKHEGMDPKFITHWFNENKATMFWGKFIDSCTKNKGAGNE